MNKINKQILKNLLSDNDLKSVLIEIICLIQEEQQFIQNNFRDLDYIDVSFAFGDTVIKHLKDAYSEPIHFHMWLNNCFNLDQGKWLSIYKEQVKVSEEEQKKFTEKQELLELKRLKKKYENK